MPINGAESTSSLRATVCVECLLDGGDKCFECGLCCGWIHFDCANIRESSVRHITDYDNVLVVCKPCEAFAQRRRSAIIGSHVVPDTADDRLSAIESQLSAVVTAVKELIPTALPCHDTNDTNPSRPTFSEIASRNAGPGGRVVFSPAAPPNDDDARHRRSMVIRGLPEQGHDHQTVTDLVTKLDPSATIEQTFRMGNYGPRRSDSSQQASPPRSRLLKVIFPSSSVARSVLSQAYRLKHLPEFASVFIRRSMPDADRYQYNALRKKAYELNLVESVRGKGDRYVVVNEKLVCFRACTREDNGRYVGGKLCNVNYDIAHNDNNTCTVNINDGGQGN